MIFRINKTTIWICITLVLNLIFIPMAALWDEKLTLDILFYAFCGLIAITALVWVAYVYIPSKRHARVKANSKHDVYSETEQQVHEYEHNAVNNEIFNWTLMIFTTILSPLIICAIIHYA